MHCAALLPLPANHKAAKLNPTREMEITKGYLDHNTTPLLHYYYIYLLLFIYFKKKNKKNKIKILKSGGRGGNL